MMKWFKKNRLLLLVLVLTAAMAVPGTVYAEDDTRSLSEGQVSQYLEGILSLLGVGDRTLKNADISKVPDQKYTGKPIQPNPRITYMGTRLTKDKDYSLSYSNNTKVGTAKIRITGKGDYSGSRTVSFNIVKKGNTSSSSKTSSSKRFTVKLTKTSYEYNGKAQKPSVKVTVSGKTVPSRDYTVSYKNNKYVGRASITVTGKNNYKGYKGTTTFKIVPRKISFTSAKSTGKGEVTLTWKKEGQADGYQVQYCTRKAFDKNIRSRNLTGSGTTSCVLTGLTSGKNIYVRLRQYTKVGKTNWYGEWSAARTVKVK